LSFYLPEQDGKIASRAAVVHSHPDPERDGQWIVACTFERMAITDRERIIRFLFFRQRELAGRPKARVR
jgi:c-di-GMP-binding flagellar brake protein YcgR